LRLRSGLRAIASARHPLQALARSATFFYAGDALLGNAAADLAVTGRTAYGRFRADPPGPPEVAALARELLEGQDGQPPAEDRLEAAVSKALSRAYEVAWALRDTDPRVRQRRRQALGWIAVSGEDDPPHRPVNTPSAPYPQYDLEVRSHGRSFSIRYMVATPR
jgi:hypothetical protein